MEQEFGERLKKYRKEKNLTQQDLADQLQVSNKTVSRWESGGGYPDVPLLVPLAKALGVTVDDLLDDEKPVRSIARSDWQNLLSFAFVIGGGVLFYLLGGFMPSPVCYLIFIGCLVYGVYLQKHYCYQSRWFRLACGVADLCVNISFLLGVFAAGAMATAWLSLLQLGYSGGKLMEAGLSGMRPEGVFSVWSMLLPFLLSVAVLTGVTMALVERHGFGKKTVDLGVRLKAPGVRDLLPPVCILLIPAFFSLFQTDEIVVRTLGKQGLLYAILVSAAIALCALLSLKKGHRLTFAAVGILALAAVSLPGLGEQWAWLPNSQRMMRVTAELSDIYERFCRPGPAMIVAAAVFALLALLPGMITVKDRVKPAD